MRKICLIFFTLFPLYSICQFYIGNSEQEILTVIQNEGSKIRKENFENNIVIISWVEYKGKTAYNALLKDNICYRTFIEPLTSTTLQQWIIAIDKDFIRGEKQNTWISYTATGKFLITLSKVKGKDNFIIEKTE